MNASVKTEKGFTFNWGWGIFLFFSSFVGFIVFMVYMTTTIDHDLVTSDYYKQEIEYQDKIDMRKNLAASGRHVSLAINKKDVQVMIPKIDNGEIDKAQIYIYRPSDETKDVKLEKHTDGLFVIPTDQLIKGACILKSEWTSNGKKYYEEIPFTMP